MATDCVPQLTFKFDKLVVARFDAEHASSDGGAVLLKALDAFGVERVSSRIKRARRTELAAPRLLAERRRPARLRGRHPYRSAELSGPPAARVATRKRRGVPSADTLQRGEECDRSMGSQASTTNDFVVRQ
jgi:hypothetical protein